MRVAAEVFANEGIARASMNEVARTCGISKANIYHYYPSKDELVFDILDTYLAELRELICTLDLTSLTPPDQLAALTRAVLLAYEGMDNEHKIQREGLLLLSIEKQSILKGYQRELVSTLSQILIACAPVRLREDKPKCRAITMSVFGMLNWFYMWNPNAGQEDRVRYAQQVTDLVLNGLDGDHS